MRTILFPAVFVAMVMLLARPCLAPPRDAFAGTWNMVVSPDEDAVKKGEKEYKDTFTFKANQFESTAMKAHGFPSTTYEEDARAGLVATFTAEAKSKKDEGAAKWTGQAGASEIQGELSWTKKDGTVLHYTFKGSRQN